MSVVLRVLFSLLVVRPLVLIALGLNVRHRTRLPAAGPAIVVANHNSHLDTLVLTALFPLRLVPRVRPVAAADYFLRTRVLAWCARHVMGIIPVERQVRTTPDAFFAEIDAALARGAILILYPEGTRGEPELLARFKNGIAHLAERHPAVPVTPVYLRGLGKALPKGDWLLVPFFCDVFVGQAMTWNGSRKEFMSELEHRMTTLGDEGRSVQM